MIGAPNSGKSSLLDSLTSAKPPVGDYAYTTREPLTGMMMYETVPLQLIDTPPISIDAYEPYLTNLVRLADIVVLVVDLSSASFLDDALIVVERLKEKRVFLKGEAGEDSEDPRIAIKKTILCAHKEYEDENGERLARLKEKFAGFDIVATSIIDDESLLNFQRHIFEAMSVIRVYTKHVGEKVKIIDPVILQIGSTIDEAARAIHKDFKAKLKFAKIWGDGRYAGQKVSGDFELHDKDIVEFHV